jgi:uncharacterized protein YabN with tetrapyrrole methylase and pyrophosphatase domain
MPSSRRSKQFDIALTGIGIGGFERVTLETLDVFKRARIIFHLTGYHRRLKQFCKKVVNLEKYYWTGEEDLTVYTRLADLFLDEARRGPGVVAVGDGHPAFYDDVTWDVYRRGKEAGLDVRILPAISCLDSMSAQCDLEIHTGGLQILDATTMVANKQTVNPHIDALIMQIGWFDSALLYYVARSKRQRFKPVIDYLLKFYSASHPLRILEAPNNKKEAATVVSTQVGLLDRYSSKLLPSSCLYIPAVEDRRGDSAFDEFAARGRDEQHLRRIAVITR